VERGERVVEEERVKMWGEEGLLPLRHQVVHQWGVRASTAVDREEDPGRAYVLRRRQPPCKRKQARMHERKPDGAGERNRSHARKRWLKLGATPGESERSRSRRI